MDTNVVLAELYSLPTSILHCWATKVEKKRKGGDSRAEDRNGRRSINFRKQYRHGNEKRAITPSNTNTIPTREVPTHPSY
jgi:hypothetical protein